MVKFGSRKRYLAAGAGILLAATLAVAFAPWWMPVSIALGPCGRDWTSPSSYSPRASPTGKVTFTVGTEPVRVCYGRPSARGRVVFGGLVPWGRLWRIGANEPTRLFSSQPLRIGPVAVGPGRYSLYAVPDSGTWLIAINRSTFHWGNDFSRQVLVQEIGRFPVPVTRVDARAETLTVSAIHGGLAVWWEQTRVVIPIAAGNE